MIKLNEKFTAPFVGKHELTQIKAEVLAAKKKVDNGTGAGSDFLGWHDLPIKYDKKEYNRIKKAAKKIRDSCDIFIVIGIGGSYLGARAAIEFIKSPLYNNMKKDTPDVYFTGNTISANALADLLEICKGKKICVNVISKSGTTTEPAITFRVFRELLEKKYGKKGAKERIFVTTDKKKGALKALSNTEGYESFVVPDDIGGRYSVLTAVGLLPIAVAGCDVDAIMAGAAEAREYYLGTAFGKNDCLRYAAIRNILYRKGKTTEIFAAYEPAVQMFCEWWKQLYGESEGKDNKGLFPASVIFSTDLHSLGQYIQSGVRNLFETVLDVQTAAHSVAVPVDEGSLDGMNFVAGKDFHEINRTALRGTLYAHNDGGVPNVVLEVPDRSERTFGNLVYFFEYACAVSGYMLGVNPFDQPGVEAYKKNMFALLGREGKEFDDIRAKLKDRK